MARTAQMESYDALREAISDYSNAVARALRCSVSLVYQWQRPHLDYTDTGAINPLDRLNTIMETSLSEGASKYNALVPLRWLAQRHGYVLIPVDVAAQNGSALQNLGYQVVKEFGELAEAIGDSLEDGSVENAEARRIEREGYDAIRAIVEIIERCKEAAT